MNKSKFKKGDCVKLGPNDAIDNWLKFVNCNGVILTYESVGIVDWVYGEAFQRFKR